MRFISTLLKAVFLFSFLAPITCSWGGYGIRRSGMGGCCGGGCCGGCRGCGCCGGCRGCGCGGCRGCGCCGCR